MMWKFLREGATVIPGATFIPESRVLILTKLTIDKIHHLIRLRFERSELKKSQCVDEAKPNYLCNILYTLNCVPTVDRLSETLRNLYIPHVGIEEGMGGSAKP